MTFSRFGYLKVVLFFSSRATDASTSTRVDITSTADSSPIRRAVRLSRRARPKKTPLRSSQVLGLGRVSALAVLATRDGEVFLVVFGILRPGRRWGIVCVVVASSPSASAGSLAGDERRSRHRDERDDAERPAAAAAAVVGERGQRRREAYRDAAQRR